MLDLNRALADIDAVRSQIARGTEFRGYGPVAFAATGIVAAAAAVVQSQVIAAPANAIAGYLSLWIGTAILSAAIIGIDVVTRSRRVHAGLADEMIQSAVEHLLPAVVAGALLTFVLVRFAPETLWMLPGLWQIVLSLGVFASCRVLPRPMFAIGVWYLGTGLACLAFARGDNAFSPLAMGIPFGVGQMFAAALIFTFRTSDAAETDQD